MSHEADDATLLTLGERAVTTFGEVVARLDPDDLARPTPCTEWDVRHVVAHAGGMCETMRRGLDGEAPRDSVPDGGGVDPSEAADAARAMLTAFQLPGALDRTLTLPWGESPARMSLQLITADLTIHTWDVSCAVGADVRIDEADVAIDEEVAAASLAFVSGMMSPEMRTPEMGFGPEVEVAEDAPTVIRLAAFTGREPGWRAG